MKTLVTAIRVLGAILSFFLLVAAIAGLVTGTPWTGLFMLILSGVCIYWAFVRRNVIVARTRRIENLQIVARAEAQHAAMVSGEPVDPAPVQIPARRGWIAGVAVAVSLIACAILGGEREPASDAADGVGATVQQQARTDAADTSPPQSSSPGASTAETSPPRSASAAASGAAAADSRAAIVATALVTRIVDGDTIEVLDDATGQSTVRILGIDTPETKKPGYTVGCWGPEAADWASQQLTGTRVALVTDPTQNSVDAYDRVLAYVVRADGWDYSIESARAGMAKSYEYAGPTQRQPAIAAAQGEAKSSARGLWGPPCNGITSAEPEATKPSLTTEPPAEPPAPTPDPPSHRAPAPAVAPAPAPEPAPVPAPAPVAYYADCADARDAGAAPLYVGDPGYRAGLDRDDDGVACE